ncbi:hypothetical protein [Floridanema evergladense]|uniref:PH domain-containing protein n=1 Tax=Floridaenema evergladense BLCC-F167 TaxID=3153639 RepID=A0ABV4WE04_9CYAN
MNSTEFQKWCEQLQLVAQTRDLIARIRAAPPERHVQGRAGNSTRHLPQPKNGSHHSI